VLFRSNACTHIIGADPFMLRMLDLELRYPSDLLCNAGGDSSPYMVGGLSTEGWDGWIRLLRTPKQSPPWFPTGLLLRACEVFQKFAQPYQISDTRVRPELGMPDPVVRIPLRDYQEEAVRRALHVGRGVVDLPPRSGKTRLGLELHRRLALPTIWLAPTDRIVRQTVEVAESFFGPHYVHHQVGSRNLEEAVRRMLVVCTTATAWQLPLEFYLSRQVIFVDEFHHASAKQYRDVFKHCEHVFYRYGMTGTFFRSGNDELAMFQHLANTILKLEPRELVGRGYLVPVKAVFLPLELPKIKRGSGNYFADHGKEGIHENEARNAAVGLVADFLVKEGRRVLVLVGTKRQGRMLESQLRGFYPPKSGTEFHLVEFVSTDCERGRHGRIIDSFNSKQEVQVLIGTSLLGEGVDLPAADALVYARGERAEVSLIQSLFRVCTAQPGKQEAVVVDFLDAHHRKLLQHAEERFQIYSGEPIFEVQKLSHLSEFPRWFEGIRSKNL
jgi:superfamily II DNA or RNA helicase